MEKSIRLQRSQSLLKELISEALGSLDNPILRALSIVDVICSKGKYHAEVFIESSDLSDQERRMILKDLKKAEGILREYIFHSSGWFKCPKMNFKFDDSLQSSHSLDQLFEKIAKERKKR